MRIIHLAGFAAPYPGSFIPMVRAAAAAVRDRGWTPEVAFPAEAGERDWIDLLVEDGVGIHLAEDSTRLGGARWLRKLLDTDDEPVLLHSSFTTFDLAAAAVSRRRPQTTSLWHVHSPILPGRLMAARARLKYSLLSGPVGRVLCCSTQVRDQVVSFGAREQRVKLLLNAIETDRFPVAGPEQRAAARRDLDLPAEAKVLMHFGWDWHFKGGDIFLAAAARLLRERGDSILPVIVGGGEPAARIARELGIDGDVKLLEPVSEVQRLYAAADVFVAPARLEGLPFALLEALASGVPVVASRIPGHELTGQALSGYVQTGLDPGEVAAGVSSVLFDGSSSPAANLEPASAWVRENLDVGPWAQRLADEYSSLLAAPSASL